MSKYDLSMFENEKIKEIDLTDTMPQYFINYAMSVIIQRALPDLRDGFKPVHRRINYAMMGLGLVPEKGHRKSARIVGEVLGKYHPHGDSSVYEAMVRLAQEWQMRYCLVDGHGNFGSVDGDSAAAMRYTEAKMNKIAVEMLRDINKNTVDFMLNFDGEEQEPVVLPSRFPNLLVNGSTGVAVGFTTNIPPHNLNNTIDQIIYQIDNENCTIGDLVNILQAPDFPTGGTIVSSKNNIENMYSNGTGSIVVRSKYVIDEQTIRITEIPYGVNKAKAIVGLIQLRDGYETTTIEKGKKVKKIMPPKIPQIDNSDEGIMDKSSVLDGINIEIVVKDGYDVKQVLKLIFKHSDFQVNFSSTFTGVLNNELLREVNLKRLNAIYINHQKEVITRRSKFDLNKYEKRLHILDGLLIALNNIDEVINIIRNSKASSEAKNILMDKFNLSDKQSEAIIELKLRRLTGLERDKIEEEYAELMKQIEYLKSILASEEKLLCVIKDELSEIKDKYGDDRNTNILYEDDLEDIKIGENIEDYNCRILYTKDGYIKKHLKQSDNHKIKDGDIILDDFTTTNKSTLLIFTDKANRYKLPVHELEVVTPSSYGSFIRNLIDLDKDENVIKIVSIENPVGYMYFAYENGKVAKVNIKSYLSANKKLQNCYNTDSKLLDIAYSEKDIKILLISSEGKGLIIDTERINPKSSRNSQGNTGIKLSDDLTCVSCLMKVDKDYKLTLTTDKDKSKYIMLDDTVSETDERRNFDYLCGRPANQGNFIFNCRANNSEIVSVKYEQ